MDRPDQRNRGGQHRSRTPQNPRRHPPRRRQAPAGDILLPLQGAAPATGKTGVAGAVARCKSHPLQFRHRGERVRHHADATPRPAPLAGQSRYPEFRGLLPWPHARRRPQFRHRPADRLDSAREGQALPGPISPRPALPLGLHPRHSVRRVLLSQVHRRTGAARHTARRYRRHHRRTGSGLGDLSHACRIRVCALSVGQGERHSGLLRRGAVRMRAVGPLLCL